jgi:tetratricopeptide (TPR) repeat protein
VFAVISIAGCGQLENLRGPVLSKRMTRAQDLLKRGDQTSAVRELDEELRANKNDPDAYLRVMTACYLAGRLDLAAQYGETAVANTSGAPPEKRAEIRRLTGMAYMQQKLFVKAIDHYEAAQKLLPNSFECKNDLGYAYAEHYDISMPGAATKLQEALRLTREAVSDARSEGVSDQVLGQFVDSLGWDYFKRQNYPEAVANLSRAAHLAPDLKEIHVHLAQALYANGRSQEAFIEMEKALKLDPKYEVAIEQMKKWKEVENTKPTVKPGPNDA